MPKNDLTNQLFQILTAVPLDYKTAENLLQTGAEPNGEIEYFGEKNNLYDAVLDILYCGEYTGEDFYLVTELLLRYGLNISRPALPYDGRSILHPLWGMVLYKGEYALRVLKALLDHGLIVDDAAYCWKNMLTEILYSSNNSPEFTPDVLADFTQKMLLIASYPHIVNADEELRKTIWYDYNHSDLTGFRDWNSYSVETDIFLCGNCSKARSLIRLLDKSSGKQVWRFGIGLQPLI